MIKREGNLSALKKFFLGFPWLSRLNLFRRKRVTKTRRSAQYYYQRWLRSRGKLVSYPHFNAIGSKAPDFQAWGLYYYLHPLAYNPDHPFPLYRRLTRKGQIRLKDYRHKKNVVLVFATYVADFDVHNRFLEFNDSYPMFRNLDTEVLFILHEWCLALRFGISLQQFYGGFRGTQIPLLSDPYKRLCTLYGTIGNNYHLAQNSVIIVDKEGFIRYSSFFDFRIGDSINELLRVLKTMKFLDNNPTKVCPPDWNFKTSVGNAGSISRSAPFFTRLYKRNLIKNLKQKEI